MDVHKHYSVAFETDEMGRTRGPVRIEHDREIMRSFLRRLAPDSQVAVETTGKGYGLIDEIEQAGLVAKLAHAGKAKAMMGNVNKTDKLDAQGLARLLRHGTLPAVWIPPAPVRDLRELARYRMVLARLRTKLKNRIHATLDKYLIRIDEVSDVFGVTGRRLLSARLGELPPETRRCVQSELDLLDYVEEEIRQCEGRIRELVEETPSMKLLKSLPGVGDILATIIAVEVGEVGRFPSPQKLASYVGTAPRVHSSGGKTSYGRTRPDVNRYLKWAFVEAASVIVLHQSRMADSRLVRTYHRVKSRRGTAVAMVAVARALAEAAWWVLTKGEEYREPEAREVSSTHGEAR